MSTAKDKAAAADAGGRWSRWVSFVKEVFRSEPLDYEGPEKSHPTPKKGGLRWLLASEQLEDAPVEREQRQSLLAWLLAPETLDDEPVARRQRRPWLAWVLSSEKLDGDPATHDGTRK